MANAFVREPVVNGDDDAWAPYLLAAVRRDEGQLSCELYNDSGALKLSKGRIGINDGTNRGCIEIDTIATLSLVGLTNNRWAQIEATVSGAAVTLSIASIAAGTDESTIPAAIKAAYDYEKQGYYVTATKRLLGIAFVRTGTLGRIVNCESGKFGFKDISYVDYFIAGVASKKYITKMVIEIGDWNMDATANIFVNTPFTITTDNIRGIRLLIRNDAGTSLYDGAIQDAADPNLVSAGTLGCGGSNILLHRRTGGWFDSVVFDATSFNRGWIFVEYET